MSCEITVIIKDEEKRLNRKFLVYHDETHDKMPVKATIDDPTVQNCINTVMENFRSDSHDIDIKVKIELSV